MAAAAYGTKIMKDLGLIPEGYKIMVVGGRMPRTQREVAKKLGISRSYVSRRN